MNRWEKGLIIYIFCLFACFNVGVVSAGSQDRDKPVPHIIQSKILASERLFGFIDQDGLIIFPPKFYYAWDFHNGLARIQPTESKKYGFVDAAGLCVLPPDLADAADFSEGLAAVKPDVNGLYGYINTVGKMVIPPRYSHAYKFINGRARVNIDGMTAYIDRAGTELLRTPYLEVWDTKGDMIPFFAEHKLGFMNQAGKVVIEPKYSPVIEWADLIFTEAITPVGLENKYGFIDKSGKVVVDFQYEWVHQFKEGLAAVSKDKHYGFIDASGNVVIPLRFEEAWNFNEGLAAVKVNDRWGFIDKQGRMVIKPEYLTPRFGGPIEFQEGLAAVRTENGSGYINKQGEMVIAPVYSYAENFSGGVAAVRFGEIRYINRQGKCLWNSLSDIEVGNHFDELWGTRPAEFSGVMYMAELDDNLTVYAANLDVSMILGKVKPRSQPRLIMAKETGLVQVHIDIDTKDYNQVETQLNRLLGEPKPIIYERMASNLEHYERTEWLLGQHSKLVLVSCWSGVSLELSKRDFILP